MFSNPNQARAVRGSVCIWGMQVNISILNDSTILRAGLFNALSERDGADSAVKDVFPLPEGKPV
jgi:hypothetical protein